VKQKELIEKLGRIEEAINTKGHPMQDYSTLKVALLDLLDVVRQILKTEDTNAAL
jgi:hypothetical protein